jgi:MFS family permease
VAGNEGAIYFGRRRLITITMIASAVCAVLLGLVGPQSYIAAVALILVYGLLISLDSSSLTAGTAGSADPSRRGATLAVHSMLGYAGGFVGPLIVGWALDLSGGMTSTAWAFAYLLVAALVMVGLIAFLVMRPGSLAGDRIEQRPAK